MEDSSWHDLRVSIGDVTEATGRKLKSKKILSHEDLTALRDTLNMCASVVQTIRDCTTEE